VLFDKIASVHFSRKYIYILALEMAGVKHQHCAICIGTLSFPTCSNSSHLTLFITTQPDNYYVQLVGEEIVDCQRSAADFAATSPN